MAQTQLQTHSEPEISHSVLPIVGWQFEEDGAICVHLAGSWTLQANAVPNAEALFLQLAQQGSGGVVRFNTKQIVRWGSTLPVFVRRIVDVCRQTGLMVEMSGLPTSVLALIVQAEKGVGCEATEAIRHGMRERAGRMMLARAAEVYAQVHFLGMLVMALGNLLRGKARSRPGELFYLINQCGPGAVPIVTLISLLVGMILAFIGAAQLRMFGAQLYIADLVGLGMAREMGAMMTAVIMAGRTGAAYAAELGSMRVNEEIDALHTLGINPIEFLVLPRVLALVLVMPLLCIYADCMGILGGAMVTVGMFDISLSEYFNESQVWLRMSDFSFGIAKSVVFGLLVAVAGCMRGMRCGGNSNDVGYAATNAVVTSIVWVVVADAILTLLYATLDA